jgi:co-chaperonin GroES (HSP10)
MLIAKLNNAFVLLHHNIAMKVSTNKIIVRAEDLYNYYVSKGDLKLYVDPLFKRGVAKTKVAQVVEVPSEMYGWSRTVPEVHVGDKVYIHHNALEEFNMIPDSKGLWVIEYEDVLCAVRDGNIIPINGRILAEPIFDDDIIEIDYHGAKRKVKMTESGLVKELDPSYNLKKARLAHIGTPQKGDAKVPINKGDVFYYILNADYKNEIEGKEYFVMFQDEIIAIQ